VGSLSQKGKQLLFFAVKLFLLVGSGESGTAAAGFLTPVRAQLLGAGRVRALPVKPHFSAADAGSLSIDESG